MGFSRHEYWSGFLCPPLGHLPDPGIKPTALMSLACRRLLYCWATAVPNYGQQNTKRPKKTKPPQMPILKSWSFQQEVGSKSRVPEHAPCTQCHKGVGRTPKPPRWPCPWTHPCPQTRRGVFPVVPNKVLRDKSVLFMHVGSRAGQSEFKSQGRRLLARCLYLSSPMEVIA